MTTSFGKAMGPSFASCGHLLMAAAKQPGTSPEAAALMKDMGATYCSVAKMMGACADCKSCEDPKDCPKDCCSDMTPEEAATKAKESHAASKKLLAAAQEDMQKVTPEQMEKMMAAVWSARDRRP